MTSLAANLSNIPAGLVVSPSGDLNFVSYSGRQIGVQSADPKSIWLEDIAHSLSMQCRFNGHCRRFISVAEHSVLVSRLVPPSFAKIGLMHDASEAYVGDVISPVKQYLDGFKELEKRWAASIEKVFDLKGLVKQPKEVKDADLTALHLESIDMCHSEMSRLVGKVVPRHLHFSENRKRSVDINIHAWSAPQAKEEFLNRFINLFGRRAYHRHTMIV